MMNPTDHVIRRRIALIGLRGSGKTTVGRELASIVGGCFLDTDQMIVKRVGRSIADIFASGGEPEFRRLERATIAEAVSMNPSVLSVGGGAVLDPENVRLLRKFAFVVWLQADPQELWKRMDVDDDSADFRPNLTPHGGLEEIQRLSESRAAAYAAAADLTMDTAGKHPHDIAREIIEFAFGPKDRS